MSSLYVLFDIGGTHTRIATTDGKTLDQIVKFNTDTSAAGFASFLGALEEVTAGRRIKAVAGGMPGQLDPVAGLLSHTPNLPDWAGLEIRNRLECQMKVPIIIENDVAMVGLGEATHGAGQGAEILAYITVSTGVNGARIVDGRIDPSARGFEIGAQLLPDASGKLTSWESLTGGAALEHKLGKHPQELGDPKVWREEERQLSRGLYNTMLHWSPDRVVMGGAMMRDIDINAIEAELGRLPGVFAAWPPIVRAKLGDEGGLYGSLVRLQQELAK